MDAGDFCFLKESYFERFCDGSLMDNHEIIGNTGYRPYYIAARDKRNPDIYWAVPLSSKYDKYVSIRDRLAAKNPNGICDTIQFAKLNSRDNAFLVQNVCPVAERHVYNVWRRADGTKVSIRNRDDARIGRATEKVVEKRSAGRSSCSRTSRESIPS